MYFIYDCNDCIVGNSKGYTKHRYALMMATRLRHELWARYDDKIKKYQQGNIPPTQWDRTIYRTECHNV